MGDSSGKALQEDPEKYGSEKKRRGGNTLAFGKSEELRIQYLSRFIFYMPVPS